MVSRRNFMKALAAGAAGGFAGCIDDPGETETTETEAEEAYQYFFEDESGTLGGAGKADIPDEAGQHQIVTNTRTEDEWRQMQVNDHNYARRILDERTIPEVRGIDEIPQEQIDDEIQEIEQSVLDIYESRTSDIEGDSAEIFTESMLAGMDEHAFGAAGPNEPYGIWHLAEYIVENNDEVQIDNYKLSPMWSRTGDAGRGFSHPVGLVQWDENGESKTRYAEVENRKTDTVVRPDRSVYAADLDTEDFGTPYLTDNPDPGNWATAFEYSKLREVQSRGELNENEQSPDSFMLDALIGNVDGARTSRHMHGDEERFDVKTGVDAQYGGENSSFDEYVDAVVSDSFGNSFESYIKSPGNEYSRSEFETATRVIFSAFEQQEFTGGIAIDGTIESPEIYKATREDIEGIRADGDYTDFSTKIAG